MGRRLIALFLGCALLPLAFFGWLALSQVSASLHGELERSLHASAKAAGMDVAARLLSLRDELNIAVEFLRQPGSHLDAAPSAMRTELRQLFHSIEVIDGNNVHPELGAAHAFAPLRDDEREHLDAGRTVARCLQSGTIGMISLVARLGAVTDGPLLSALVRTERIADLEGLRGSGTEVLVFASDMASQGERGHFGDNLHLLRSSLAHHPDLEPLTDRIGGQQSAATFDWPVAGKPHVARYWRVFLQPQLGMDWYVVQSRPRSTFEQPLTTFRQTFLMTALLTFLLVAAASLAQIRRTIGPIRHLVGVTERVGAGDLDARAGLDGKDEFAQLGQSFDAMTEQLVENIRRRELTEVDLITARDAALAAVRAKAEFMTNVSHELRTPLTSIVSSAEILRDFGDEDPATRREFLGIVVDQAERLQRLIEGVLALHDEDRQHFTPTDLATALRDAIHDLPTDVQGRIDLSIDDETARVSGSPERLAYAFRHLLDNAAKFSGSDAPIEVRLHRRGDQCLVDIRDYGIGIAETNRERVFEPFCQLSSNQLTQKASGIGLGLTLARSIVGGHGGRITISTPRGPGTVFRVALPALVASLLPISTPAPATDALAQQQA